MRFDLVREVREGLPKELSTRNYPDEVKRKTVWQVQISYRKMTASGMWYEMRLERSSQAMHRGPYLKSKAKASACVARLEI